MLTRACASMLLLSATLALGQSTPSPPPGVAPGWSHDANGSLVMPVANSTAVSSVSVVGIQLPTAVSRPAAEAATARLPSNCADASATKCVLWPKPASKPAFVGGADPSAEISFLSSTDRGLETAFSSVNGVDWQGGGDGAVGDIDGDGDLDIIIASGQAKAMLGNGIGGFTPGSLIGGGVNGDADWIDGMFEMGGNCRIALGDIDGDADLDLVLGRRALLFTNSGSGSFSHVSTAPFSRTLAETNMLGGAAVVCVSFGDVDGDNDLDLVVGLRIAYDAHMQVWTNDGAGAFTMVGGDTSNGYRNLASYSAFPMLGDLDGDGDLDMFCGQVSYINGGTGIYSVITNSAVPDYRNGPKSGEGVAASEQAYDIGVWRSIGRT